VRLPALLLALVLGGCKSGGAAGSPADGGPDAAAPCTVLFGNPNAKTGLGPDQCQPACVRDGQDFTPPVYDAAFIQSLITDWALTTPYPPLTSDPYTDAGAGPAPDPAGTVCAVLPQGLLAGATRGRRGGHVPAWNKARAQEAPTYLWGTAQTRQAHSRGRRGQPPYFRVSVAREEMARGR